MIITINGNSMKFDGPQPLSVIIRAMLPDTCEQVFACFVNGAVIELKSIVDKSAELIPITYRDEEGKRIYERSLRFVLLLAARELFPDYHVRIEHSIGQGVYLLLEGRRLYPGDVEALEGMMRDFIKRDLPFVQHAGAARQPSTISLHKVIRTRPTCSATVHITTLTSTPAAACRSTFMAPCSRLPECSRLLRCAPARRVWCCCCRTETSRISCPPI
ncbi:MAG TPA: hypothetical protein PK321_03805 [Clostridia bacterium]|nr:hypothetical protein [Clostridia bacterium]